MSGPLGSSQWMYNSGSEYEINQSLRFDDASTEYLKKTDTQATAAGRKNFSVSFWAKYDYFTSGSAAMFRSESTQITLESGRKMTVALPSSVQPRYAPLIRDPGAWYHMLFVIDTTQGTAANRVKFYLNGDLILSENSSTPSQDSNVIESSGTQYIGSNFTPGGAIMKGYLAEYHFLDTISASPSDFGETGDYGEWKPVKYSGSYGTNGFYLDFADSSALGNDVSGNDNDWTPVNLSASDQVLDSPSNNFCVINELDVQTVDKLKEGNLYANSGPARCRGTMAVSSGKWYYEMLMVYQHHGTAGCGIRGVGGEKISVDSGNDYVYINHPNNSGVSINVGGSTTGDLSNGVVSGGSGDASPGSIIGVMWDMDAETITFKSNNSALASALTDVDFSGISNKETIAPYFLINGGRTAVVNFGQDSSFAGLKTAQGNQDSNDIGDFYYTPPSDYLAICTKNLPAPAVTPSEHFETVIYTGNGGTQSISSLEFQPDFTWIKSRSIIDSNHLFDSVRGAGQRLRSDSTGQQNYNETVYLTSFDSAGFSLGGDDGVNKNTATYVAWNWKANGGASSVGSNTNGSINTTDTSANSDAGYSISTYTGNATSGATIGHGLSKAPEVIIVSVLSQDGGHNMYHTAWGSAAKTAPLQSYEPSYTNANIWNSTAPGASVFTIGNNSVVNTNNATYVAHCWHSVDGFSKFGFYEGDGDNNGPFIYCGFRPSFIMLKNGDAYQHYTMYDTKRSTSNLVNTAVYADVTEAESSAAEHNIDILSNGFKVRNNAAQNNTNNNHYMFMAFAETPFKYSSAR